MRAMQIGCNGFCERVRAAEHAPRGPFRVLERRRGLAEIVERSGGVLVDRLRVVAPQLERDLVTLAENASCHGQRFAKECLGFFEAL